MANENRKEELRARMDGARLVKNSGRGMNKGDAVYHNILIDYKFTEKDSYSLNINKFQKHLQDAFSHRLQPAIVVIYENHKNRAIAMVEWPLLQELIDENNDLHSQIDYLNEELEYMGNELNDWEERWSSS